MAWRLRGWHCTLQAVKSPPGSSRRSGGGRPALPVVPWGWVPQGANARVAPEVPATFSEEEQELEKALEEEVALAKKAMGNAKAALEGAAHDLDKARAELTKARVPAWVKRIRRYANKLQEKYS